MLREIRVNNYRLLDEFRAQFRRINVVVGANASGKSTLIDFLQFISDLAGFGIQEVVDFHGGLWSIANAGASKSQSCDWTLQFERPEGNTWWSLTAPIASGDVFSYEVKLSMSGQGQVSADKEELTLIQGDVKRVLLKAEGTRSLALSERTGQLEPFDDALVANAAAPSGQPGPTGPDGGSGGQGTTGRTLKLTQMRFANDFPIQTWVRNLLSQQAFYPGFDVTRSSALRTKPADIRAQTTLSANGENLGTVLHEILTRYDYRLKADELKEFLRTAYPQFEDITAETSYGAQPKVLVRLRESGLSKPMEVWELSDGTLRFLCLAAALLNPFPPALLVLDEPELGLHPRLLPIVGDLIKVASEQSQVIVTTHSPELLNRFELDDIAVLAREGSRVHWYRPSDSAALKMLLQDVVGEKLGDLHRTGELEAGV
ncbi:MAG: hypothetical protein JWN40_518 [Phycisphaerales bacterium]|nr:hypothetical protein [Phycisphaerales bacterium]